jgi:hypothetical protein
MIMQVTVPEFEALVGEDRFHWGLSFSNSEVGLGAWNIESFLWRLICSNGARVTSLLRKYHVGRRLEETNGDSSIFQEDTVQADSKAMQLVIRDVVKDAMRMEVMEEALDKLRQAKGMKISDPVQTIKNVTKRWPILSDADGKSILMNMVEEKEFSAYGLMNGITYLAHEIEADKGYDLQQLGYEIASVSKTEWDKIAA